MSTQEQEHWRRLLLRTEATADYYEKVQKEQPEGDGCRLCNDPETYQEFKYWRLVPNRFPYDRYFSKSDMLVTKRHVDESELSQEERGELIELKSQVLIDDYDVILENLPKQKSIPHHHHIHLAKIKKPDKN